MTGRPPRYAPELADCILEQRKLGRHLSHICADPGMPCQNTVRQWVQRNEDGFAARYEEARKIGGQIMIDELLQIGDDLPRGRNRHQPAGEPAEPAATREEIEVARLRSEGRRWILSR